MRRNSTELARHVRMSHYERLSALDASFLGLEEPNARWHEGAVMIFDRGPLTTPDGAVDIAKITRVYASALDRVERYRQRLATIPFFDHPVWVDDPSFDIRFHIRHVALPRPGTERQLKRVSGYLLSQPLDMTKPLWEVWVVEGMEDGRFALVTKTHHCMVDGAAGMSILAALLRAEPEETCPDPRAWSPRPAPSDAVLVGGELGRRLTAPLELIRPLLNPLGALRSARDVAIGILEAAQLGWTTASDTLFNPEQIGPHRRFDWAEMSLADIKEVKDRLGGTVNDVVLATAAGAIGEFLRGHRASTRDLDFRALVPVNIRSEKETRTVGNRVAMMMAELPVGEPDPRERMRKVAETTGRLKKSKQALGVGWLEDFADRIGGRFFLEMSRSATRSRPFNVAVTNVPGPPMPLYLMGARLRAIYPMMPLFSNQALGVAVISYAGNVFWGFNSDWDTLPDLHDLVLGVGSDFEKLRKAAVEAPA
jgi:diacylglycerol O-acyltransferase